MSNNKYKILVVEDEANIRSLLSTMLGSAGYQTIEAENGKTAQMLFASYNPDLILLDLGLPDQDGMEVLQRVRQEAETPVIVLSARNDERDKVEALDQGANDYVTKPFGAAELLARVRSALRNSHRGEGASLPGKRFTLRELVIDYEARQVLLNQEIIHLTQTEYNILALLAEHSGKMMTYAAIVRAVWGGNDEGSVKKLQVNMANIRKKLRLRPGENSYIVNELGVGYRMETEREGV